MSRELVLVAASGLAREIIEAVTAGPHYDVIGVVDDDPARCGELVGGVKVLGGVDVLADYPDADVLVCAGKGGTRQELVNRLAADGIDESRFGTVVHPSVSVPDSCAIGRGSVVLAGCVLTADIALGRHVVMMPNVTLTHDVVVEDFATICAGVSVGGAVRIGPRSYLGMAASVRERCYIHADAVVGMGAVVLDDVPEHQTWAGCPARRLGRP